VKPDFNTKYPPKLNLGVHASTSEPKHTTTRCGFSRLFNETLLFPLKPAVRIDRRLTCVAIARQPCRVPRRQAAAPAGTATAEFVAGATLRSPRSAAGAPRHTAAPGRGRVFPRGESGPAEAPRRAGHRGANLTDRSDCAGEHRKRHRPEPDLGTIRQTKSWRE